MKHGPHTQASFLTLCSAEQQSALILEHSQATGTLETIYTQTYTFGCNFLEIKQKQRCLGTSRFIHSCLVCFAASVETAQ